MLSLLWWLVNYYWKRDFKSKANADWWLDQELQLSQIYLYACSWLASFDIKSAASCHLYSLSSHWLCLLNKVNDCGQSQWLWSCSENKWMAPATSPAPCPAGPNHYAHALILLLRNEDEPRLCINFHRCICSHLQQSTHDSHHSMDERRSAAIFQVRNILAALLKIIYIMIVHSTPLVVRLGDRIQFQCTAEEDFQGITLLVGSKGLSSRQKWERAEILLHERDKNNGCLE